MSAPFLADLLALVHLLFVLFVLFGGVLTWRWPRSAWLHLPALAWGVALELMGWPCPLTGWEFQLRGAAPPASAGEEGFVAALILPILYPAALSRDDQQLLGILLLTWNAGIYLVARRHHQILHHPPNRS